MLQAAGHWPWKIYILGAVPDNLEVHAEHHIASISCFSILQKLITLTKVEKGYFS